MRLLYVKRYVSSWESLGEAVGKMMVVVEVEESVRRWFTRQARENGAAGARCIEH